MQGFIERLVHFLPLLFGIGFIAPLTSEVLHAWGMPAVAGVPALAWGLLLGLAWGGFATWQRRWL